MRNGEREEERLVPDLYFEKVETRMNNHSGKLHFPPYMFVVLSSVSMGVTSSSSYQNNVPRQVGRRKSET